MPTSLVGKRVFPGAIRLFRLAGIGVYLHWTWAVVAFIELQARADEYGSWFWNAAEYLTLFLIVLLHEFGHALACRSVRGRADRILLWPLGGIAYVAPPRRPGAVLWSIAAGPLVNLALLPSLIALVVMREAMLPDAPADLHRYLFMVAVINAGLLIFNLLPIYPLDGGQILRAILWFFVGPVRSLSAAAVVGIIGAAGLVVLAVVWRDIWLVFIAVFAVSQSWHGLKLARLAGGLPKKPRYAALRCPSCGEAPPVGAFWVCDCGRVFDTVAAQAVCPHCTRAHPTTECPFCGVQHPFAEWGISLRERPPVEVWTSNS